MNRAPNSGRTRGELRFEQLTGTLSRQLVDIYEVGPAQISRRLLALQPDAEVEALASGLSISRLRNRPPKSV
jgi:hypothetical protein